MGLALSLVSGLAAPVLARPADRPHLAPPASLFREAITLPQFVTGSLRFIVLHETGHGLVELYSLPVLGREEDAADRFATFWLQPDGHGETGVDAVAAMEWWLAAGKANTAKREDLPWWDEHGIDEQRGFGIACLLYGTDPEDYAPLASRVGIPQRRLEGCMVEAAQNTASWSALLKGKVSTLSNLDTFFVYLKYEDPSAATRDAAEIARKMGILEQVRDLLHQFRYTDTDNSVTLVAKDCGVSNAFWNPQANELTVCYELINEVAEVGYAAGFR